MTDRREFLKLGVGAALAVQTGRVVAQAASQGEAQAGTPREKVRVGFVGVGAKGSSHVGSLLRMDAVDLVSVCDVVEEQCRETQRQAKRLGLKPPTMYFNGDHDFERMCADEDLDLVYTATPWRWHTPICLAAMKNGKHAATEIPAAVTVEECWQLVEASEATGKHCVMMENVNYQRNEMTILNMVRKGLLGELVHGDAGYLHDTRYLKIRDYGDGLWLGDHHATRNGNLYPPHGLGPLAVCMNVNRGDRFDYLVSMSSKPRGMDLYAAEHLPKGHPKRERKYINGDVNTCLIRTVNGCQITLTHDTDLPRPYSRTNLVQGTRGVVRGFPDFKVCLEGDDHRHKWESGEDFAEKYTHPLWRWLDKNAPVVEAPYGPIGKDAVWHYKPMTQLRGGDYLEDFRLIEAIRKGIPPDYDVYDAASWSAVAGLSESSVANRSRPIDFPDFTKGQWKTRPPVEIS